MREFYRDEQMYSRRLYHRKRYGFWKFCVDITMTAFTGGLWLIWIFCREMRGR